LIENFRLAKIFCPFLPGDAKRNQKNLWLAERAPAMVRQAHQPRLRLNGAQPIRYFCLTLRGLRNGVGVLMSLIAPNI